MANRFPLLEQMRSSRQQREDEITAPYRDELDRAAAMIGSLQRRLRDIEAALGSKLGNHIIERAGDEMSRAVRRAVVEAAAKSPKSARDFTVKPPKDIMAFFDSRSVESDILRRYRSEVLPRLSLRVEDGMSAAAEQEVTVIDIRVPQFGYRQAVYEPR